MRTIRRLFLLLLVLSAETSAMKLHKRLAATECDDSMEHHVALCNELCAHGLACGGTLIDKSFVLTAAHCMGDRKQVLVMKNNDHDLSHYNDAEKIEVESFHQPKFDRASHVGDIMLVKLREQTTREIVVKLPELDDCNKSHDKYAVAGWGKFSVNTERSITPSPPPYMLGCLDLTGVDCPTEGQLRGTADNFCAKSDVGNGVHHGDSGGGLISGGKVYGVVSRGNEPVTDQPILFTKVCSHLDWIRDKMNEEKNRAKDDSRIGQPKPAAPRRMSE